ncbi:S1 family peptidase [Hyalangium rubrum]|uniref:Serine protease n=1 Tax=Hyalangium rubrum TaxID=3103134 RepID=A0ABU5HIM1_9BACT|nr:serine protease [Hyalangium sp. s54d21]MDY7232724.1 serine protease [Hyalangium sp. s54d21]
MRMVVMINGASRGKVQFGAGLIIGNVGKVVYVLTANHVLRNDRGKMFDKLKVRLWAPWSKPQWVEAGSLKPLAYDKELDLSVAVFELPESLGNYLSQVSLRCLTDSGNFSERMPVSFIGQGGGIPWFSSTSGNALVRPSSSGERILFESSNVEPGASGGGLFTPQWELMGLVQAVSPKEGQAFPIDKALEWAAARGYPVSLRRHVAIYDFSADPAFIPADSTTTLSWKASYGTACRIEPRVGVVPAVGSVKIDWLTETTRFSLVCSSPNDPLHIVKEVLVALPRSPRIISFVSQNEFEAYDDSPSSVKAKRKADGNVTLTWETEDARRCTLDGEDVPTQGLRIVKPVTARSYTLVCYNEGLVDMRATVAEAINPPVAIQYFGAKPVEDNGSKFLNLYWNVVNGTECRLVGGDLNRDVRPRDTLNVAPPRSSTIYYLRCQGIGGPVSQYITVDAQ